MDAQIRYYGNSADKLAKPSRWLHRAEFVLAGLAAVITAVAANVGKGKFDIAPLTAVLTTLAATLLAHLQAARYDENIVSFRATASRLANLQDIGRCIIMSSHRWRMELHHRSCWEAPTKVTTLFLYNP